jgi:hypothetical protein
MIRPTKRNSKSEFLYGSIEKDFKDVRKFFIKKLINVNIHFIVNVYSLYVINWVKDFVVD